MSVGGDELSVEAGGFRDGEPLGPDHLSRLAAPSRRSLMQRRAALLRRARYMAAILLLPFAALHVLNDDAGAMVAALATAAGLSLALVGVNIWASAARFEVDPIRLRHYAMVELAADTVIAVIASWLLLADLSSAGWLVLVLPMLEGALRLERTGTTIAWLAVTVGHLAGLAVGSRIYSDVDPSVALIASRVAVLTVTAWVALAFTEELGREAAAARRARAIHDRRGDILALVAESGRLMTSLDPAQVERDVIDTARRIAPVGVALARRKSTGGWSVLIVRPLLSGGDEGERLARAAATFVHANRNVHRFSAADLEGELVADLGRAGEMVAYPMRTSGEVASVLVVAAPQLSWVVEEALTLVTSQAATVIGQAEAFQDAEALRARLSHRAYHDDLTGLANRAQFAERLREQLGRTSAAGIEGEAGVAVLFVDLDGFKAVNDSLGHTAGDVLLEAAARRMEHAVRPDDVVARVGGDEFTVLMAKAESSSATSAVARRLKEVLAEPFNINGRVCRVTASIGIAYTSDRSIDPDDFVRQADAAMYRAKRGGRDQIVMDDGSALRLELGD